MFTNTRSHPQAHVRTHTHAHTYTHTYTHTHIHTHSLTHTHTHMQLLAVVALGGRPVVDRKWVDDSFKKGEWLSEVRV